MHILIFVTVLPLANDMTHWRESKTNRNRRKRRDAMLQDREYKEMHKSMRLE